MSTRMFDHGQRAFGTFIYLFKWARGNVENPGCKSCIVSLISKTTSDNLSCLQGFHGFSGLLPDGFCGLLKAL